MGLENKEEDNQHSNGESNLPVSGKLFKESLTNALSNKKVEFINISRRKKGEIPEEIPHGRGRLIVAGFALGICLIAPCFSNVPDNVRTGLLTIGGAISTSLFKGFENN
ncbi:hypothetical protein OMCYN_01803 [cyanobiont of Ornithocercus magnificus]|nr:hypothetical protein OMCYN_01803 [cyanobiont of Ornithocercus magnificus]